MKALSIATLAMMALSGTASAQYTSGSDTTLTNIALRLGAVAPLDSRLDRQVNGLFGFGIDYYLDRSLLKNSTSYISVDWISENIKGNKNLFPIFINQKFNFGHSVDSKPAYGFLGLGVMIVDIDRSGTKLAIRGGVGMELGSSLFLETAVTFSDEVKGIRGNTIGAYLGYRF